MKCPSCWAEKAYVRRVKGWKGVLLACLFMRPMKCHHCYHTFTVSRIFTIGQSIYPPPRTIPIDCTATPRNTAGQFPGSRKSRGYHRRADAA